VKIIPARYYIKFYKLLYSILLKCFKQNHILFIYSDYSKDYKNLETVFNALKKSSFSSNNIKVIKPNSSYIISIFKLSRAKVVVIDAANKVLSKLTLSDKTTCLQVWHSGGLFKKVGFDAVRKNFDPQKEEIRINRIHGNIDYFVISDEKLIPEYMRMFRLSKDQVLPFGLPRTDELLSLNSNSVRSQLEKMSPKTKGKKLLMYAPTFRTEESGRTFKNFLDITLLKKSLGNEWEFLIRKHPSLKNTQDSNDLKEWIDVSNLDGNFTLTAADVLVTDFSSIMFDFSLLNKKVVLLKTDYNSYLSERGVYLEPEDLVGSDYVVQNTNELISLLQNLNNLKEQDLAQKYMSACNGNSTRKVVDFILELVK
jgi:CDP-ribitol ribitolphosphotransferase